MATQRIGAGFDYIYYGVVNSDGYVQGNTSTGATAGDATGQSLLRLWGAQTMPIAVPENDVTTVLGDNDPMVSFTFPSGDLPSGVFEMAARDADFDALVQGTLVESLGDTKIGVKMPSGASQPDMCLLLMRESKKWEAGSRGTSAWEIVFVPKCTITPLGRDITQREHSPYRYSFNVQKSDRKPWGATFTDLLNQTTEGAFVEVDADNPVMLHTHIGNNSTQNFNLLYTPKTTAKVHPFVNAIQQNTPGDYSVSGSQVQFVAAPALSAIINTLYEVDESNL